MKTTLAILILLVASGCSHSKPKQLGTPTPDRHATTPEPVEVAKPDPAPIVQDVTTAKAETQAAQSGLADLAKAAASAGPAALSAIQSIQNHLTDAVKALDSANAHIKDLEAQIAAKEKFIADEKAAYATNAANYEKEKASYEALVSKNTAALQAQIKQLQDENLSKLQKYLYIFSVILMLGGIFGSLVSAKAMFLTGMIGSLCSTAGGVLVLGFAHMLPKLAEYAEIGVIGIVAVFLIATAIIGFEALHHTIPAKAVTP